MRSLGNVRSLNDSPLIMMLINLQSITSKKEVIWEVLEIYSPDIITGCKTWLTSSILDNEVIPRNYKLYRKDRSNQCI